MLPSKEWEELFTRKEWILEFIWINFSSYLIVDIRDGKDKPYDISTRGVSLKHQSGLMQSPLHWLCDFDDLLRLNEDFSLMKPSMKRFDLMMEAISDECVLISTARPEKVIDPSSALDSVEEPQVMYHYANKLLKGMEETDNYKNHISICKKHRATYLREVENANESSVFVRLVDKLLDVRKEVVSKTRGGLSDLLVMQLKLDISVIDMSIRMGSVSNLKQCKQR